MPSRSWLWPVLACLLFAPVVSAQESSDLKDYRTVETALSTTITKSAATTPQPAYLGLSLDRRGDGKFVVVAVEAGSPAQAAGVKKNDVVLQLNKALLTQPEVLREALLAAGPGETLLLNLLRDGKAMNLEVQLGAVSRPLKLGKERAVLGIKVFEEGGNIKVSEVTKDSPAGAAGIQVGDLLLHVNKTPITAPGRLTDLLLERKPGDTVQLTLKRGEKEFTVSPKLTAETGFRKGITWDTRGGGLFKKEEYRLAVIPIAYPDQAINKTITTKDWEESLFSEGTYKDKKNVTGQPVHGSLNDYYREISYGKLRVKGKVFDPIEVGKKRAEYAAGSNKFALLTEALDKIVSRDGKDAFKDYDGFFFLYAGQRFGTQRGGLYWPHKSFLKWGTRTWNYFICPEGGSRMDSISVIAHEFGHMLGLPDLYAKPEVPEMEGLYVWCTMANGHGSQGKPLHFSAFCKERLGWLTPTVIDPTVKQKLILRPVYDSTKECFKVLIRPDGSEYLLLENRGGRGYDKELPGQGLLIWRVLDGKPFLEESHGVSGPAGPRTFLGSVPYPSKSNNAFTPYTTPSSRSPRGSGLPVHITNIQKLPDGRVTFWIGYEFF